MSYISETTDALIANSICKSIVGPEVYTLIAEWEKRCIPLEVVTDTIAREGSELCSNNTDLCFNLNQAVLRNFRQWLQNSVAS